MSDGTSDFIHSGDFYDDVNRFADDLPFYLDACVAAGRNVLELCCGTGRLTIPLAESGVSIEGLDRSASMLARAKAKADTAGVAVTWHQGDMRCFELKSRYGLVMLPFNSLQLLYGVDDVLGVFSGVRAHLAPGGRFVFDVFNPDFHYIHSREEQWTLVQAYTASDGTDTEISERCQYDAAAQVNRVVWQIRHGSSVREEPLHMRCYFPLEMQALIRLAGFRCLETYGSFSREPFVSNSAKQIFICEPV
jgi:ubiquinone/menaquinone biosynthesis C-methylase UbiE